jgi:hypothetical protein
MANNGIFSDNVNKKSMSHITHASHPDHSVVHLFGFLNNFSQFIFVKDFDPILKL